MAGRRSALGDRRDARLPNDGLFSGWRQRVTIWSSAKGRIRELYLFGSRAKGDFEEHSDVDIAYLITGDEPGEKLAYSICECSGWEAELSEMLGATVDLQFTDTEDDLRVWGWVQDHGQLLYRRAGYPPPS